MVDEFADGVAGFDAESLEVHLDDAADDGAVLRASPDWDSECGDDREGEVGGGFERSGDAALLHLGGLGELEDA